MITSTGTAERFQDFLRTFQTGTEEQRYRKTLRQLNLSGQYHIVVDFKDLITHDKNLAIQITDNPDELLPHIEHATLTQLKIEDPQYAEKLKTVKVRFKNLPDHHTLRQVGAEHMGKLILIDGIIVQLNPVKKLRLMTAAFRCKMCENFTYLDQSGDTMSSPELCKRCQSPLLEFSDKQSTFINLQEIGIQELSNENLKRSVNPKTTKAHLPSKQLLPENIIVQSNPIKLFITKAAFQCKKCKNFMYLDQSEDIMVSPKLCERCQSPLLEFVDKQSTFINLPLEHLPLSMDITLTEDLIDTPKLGATVSVTGIVKAQHDKTGRRTSPRTFELLLDANYIEIRKNEDPIDITTDANPSKIVPGPQNQGGEN